MLLCSVASYGQSADSAMNKVLNFPSKLFSRIQSKSANLDQQLTQQTEKYLEKMEKREERLKKKLSKTDSAGAARLFAGTGQQYATMLQKFRSDTSVNKSGGYSGPYQPYADSLQTSLAFLQKNPQLLGATGAQVQGQVAGLQGQVGQLQQLQGASGQLQQLQGASAQLQQLQAKMSGTDEVKAFLQQRKEQIKQYLSQYTHLPGGLNQEYQGMNADMYYYSQQVQHYKDMLNNPDELEKKALAILDQTATFQSFMKNNSQLAGLFGLPGNASNGAGGGAPQVALAGLQTRDQLQQMIQGQIAPGGTGGTAAVGQSVQSAQSQLSALKDKLSQYGAGGENIESPDFKPNDQKTKNFLGRLEFGVNMQTSRTNYDFPTVTDFGLSLGYKLNQHNSVGVGASYKLGWGNGINDIALTSQGVGLRSFVNIQVKGSWSATGGLEYNYETPFTSVHQIDHLSYWTPSGLVGVSKTVSVKSRVFKKTSVQLLWDFLSYEQVPKTQPILFRMGYGF